MLQGWYPGKESDKEKTQRKQILKMKWMSLCRIDVFPSVKWNENF